MTSTTDQGDGTTDRGDETTDRGDGTADRGDGTADRGDGKGEAVTDLREKKATTPDRTWWQEHSELGVSALLALTGLLVLTDSLLGTDAGSDSDPLGPHAVPFVLGALLLVLAGLLALDVLRGGHGEAEAGEDIDLAAPTDRRTVLTLAGVLVATAVLIPVLGWPLAGMALFWGATHTLGSREFPRDPLIAAGVSLTTWIIFDALLGVDLPGGPLMGVGSWIGLG